MIVIIIDILAAIMSFIGMWSLGNKKKEGFLWFIGADIFWVIVGISKDLPGLIICCSILFGVNIINYRKWIK